MPLLISFCGLLVCVMKKDNFQAANCLTNYVAFWIPRLEKFGVSIDGLFMTSYDISLFIFFFSL